MMERILVQNSDCKLPDSLPESEGLIVFYKGQEALYATETMNLKHTLSLLKALRESDSDIIELFGLAEYIQLEPAGNGLEALIKMKLLLSRTEPVLNARISLWKHYVYLAINPAEFPFVKATEFTDEDWFYLGPFRSRFYLYDLMELMQKLLKLPHCEVKQGPCEKLDDGRCRGWCLLIKTEAESTAEDKEEQPNLQKLDALLKEAYVHVDNGLLELLQQEKDKYENDLEFARADAFSDNISLLKRYREWLTFLYKVKNLNFVKDKISVKGGQLIHFKAEGREYNLPYVNVRYRSNELLALNKNLLDEARILYRESL